MFEGEMYTVTFYIYKHFTQILPRFSSSCVTDKTYTPISDQYLMK